MLVFLISVQEIFFMDSLGLSNAVSRFVEVVNALLVKLDIFTHTLKIYHIVNFSADYIAVGYKILLYIHT